MKNSLLVLTIILLGGLNAHAQIGDFNQLKNDIEAGRQPVYIDALMSSINGKLQAFTKENGMWSRREMLAFFLTMPAMLSAIQDAVQVAVGESVFVNHGDKALIAAVAATRKFAESGTWKIAQNTAHYVALNVISRGARDAAQMAFAEALGQNRQFYLNHKRAHSYFAEWGALNYLEENFGAIIEPVYKNTLENLPKNLMDNPFSSYESWRCLQDEHFKKLSVDAMVFLGPWHTVLGGYLIARDQAACRENALPWLGDELTLGERAYNHLRFQPAFGPLFNMMGF